MLFFSQHSFFSRLWSDLSKIFIPYSSKTVKYTNANKYAKVFWRKDINGSIPTPQATVDPSLTVELPVAIQLILQFTCLISIRVHSALSLHWCRNRKLKVLHAKCSTISPAVQGV